MTFSEFMETYKPVRNPIALHAQFGNTLFNVAGKEQDIVYQAPPTFVWTLLRTDDGKGVFLVPGRRFTNRVGYFIASVEYTGAYMEITPNVEQTSC